MQTFYFEFIADTSSFPFPSVPENENEVSAMSRLPVALCATGATPKPLISRSEDLEQTKKRRHSSDRVGSLAVNQLKRLSLHLVASFSSSFATLLVTRMQISFRRTRQRTS